jgi:hypothetical protein
MRLIVILLVLFLLFGGGGYFGNQAGWFAHGNPYGYGFGGLGLLVVILLVLFLLRGAVTGAIGHRNDGAAFIATIGVNSHVSTGANGYSSIPNVIADMNYLGITADRDGDNGDFSSLQSMANAGIKFDFLFAGGGAFTASAIQVELNVVHALPAGSVYAVEGPNEINNFPVTYNGVGGLQGAINFQTALYSMAHADTALPGVKVFYFTGYGAGGIAVGPNPATTPGLPTTTTSIPILLVETRRLRRSRQQWLSPMLYQPQALASSQRPASATPVALAVR